MAIRIRSYYHESQLKVKRIAFLTNIPSPYRIELFNSLDEARPSGLHLQVFFLSSSEPNRSWPVCWEECRFFYSHTKGMRIEPMPEKYLYFNPLLIWRLIRFQPHLAILGTSWIDPNNLILLFLKKVGIINFRLAYWSEANPYTRGELNTNHFRKTIRRVSLP
jgi:hypothetical protein